MRLIVQGEIRSTRAAFLAQRFLRQLVPRMPAPILLLSCFLGQASANVQPSPPRPTQPPMCAAHTSHKARSPRSTPPTPTRWPS